MTKILHILAVFFASLLAVLFVLTTVLVLAEMDIYQHLLDPDYLRSLLADNDVYPQVPAISAEVILQTRAFDDLIDQDYRPPLFVLKIPEDDLKTVLTMAYPPEEIQVQVEAYLDGVFAFLEEESDEISFSMAAVKAPLSGYPVEPYLQEVLAMSPDCTPVQVAALVAAPSSPNLPHCNPPESQYAPVFANLKYQMFRADSAIPDEFLYEISSGAFWENPLATIRLVNRLLPWLPLLPCLLLLGVAALAVRSAKGALRWLGIPLFFSGLLCLGLYVTLRFSAPVAWEAFLYSGQYEYLTSRLSNLLNPLGGIVLNDLAGWLLLPATLLLGIGLLAGVLSFFLKGRQKTPA